VESSSSPQLRGRVLRELPYLNCRWDGGNCGPLCARARAGDFYAQAERGRREIGLTAAVWQTSSAGRLAGWLTLSSGVGAARTQSIIH